MQAVKATIFSVAVVYKHAVEMALWRSRPGRAQFRMSGHGIAE